VVPAVKWEARMLGNRSGMAGTSPSRDAVNAAADALDAKAGIQASPDLGK